MIKPTLSPSTRLLEHDAICGHCLDPMCASEKKKQDRSREARYLVLAQEEKLDNTVRELSTHKREATLQPS